MLQQRGYYTISLGNGKKISLRFCTWTFKRFCEINGNMTLSELLNVLGGDMTPSALVSLLLCAAEYVCMKEKKEFKYDDMDASEWIDEMGGIAGSAFVDMIGIITASLTDSGSNGQEKKMAEKTKS